MNLYTTPYIVYMKFLMPKIFRVINRRDINPQEYANKESPKEKEWITALSSPTELNNLDRVFTCKKLEYKVIEEKILKDYHKSFFEDGKVIHINVKNVDNFSKMSISCKIPVTKDQVEAIILKYLHQIADERRAYVLKIMVHYDEECLTVSFGSSIL